MRPPHPVWVLVILGPLSNGSPSASLATSLSQQEPPQPCPSAHTAWAEAQCSRVGGQLEPPDMGVGVCTRGRGKRAHFGLSCSIPSFPSWMGPSQVRASAVWRESCSRRKDLAMKKPFPLNPVPAHARAALTFLERETPVAGPATDALGAAPGHSLHPRLGATGRCRETASRAQTPKLLEGCREVFKAREGAWGCSQVAPAVWHRGGSRAQPMFSLLLMPGLGFSFPTVTTSFQALPSLASSTASPPGSRAFCQG